MKPYTIMQFNQQYPNDDVCLDTIFANRYGNQTICTSCGVTDTKWYRVKGRKCYACKHCGYQLHPLAGTIFHKSDTPLTKWFFAIFLFANSKNGVSAKELERHLGVTYKCAWRIAKQIRLLMQSNNTPLSGVVEIDETYVGGVEKGVIGRSRKGDKTIVLGMVERGGSIKAMTVPTAAGTSLLPHIRDNIAKGTQVMTDQLMTYKALPYMGFEHDSINHTKAFGIGNVHTNTIEGFWSQLKRSIDGTHHAVSPKYLPHYVQERAYHYNHRGIPVFPLLVEEAGKPVL